MRSKKQAREWEKRVDRSTPAIRRLLDRLEEARPDMAPLKLSSDPTDPRMCCTKPLRSPGHGYFGCYILTAAWIRREIRHMQAQRRREHRQEVLQGIGAFI